MTIRFTARARRDIEEIYSYIAKENPQAARRVRAAIMGAIELLASRPYIGIKNARAPELRSRLVSRYPYRIHYLVSEQNLWIVHIRHGALGPLDTP